MNGAIPLLPLYAFSPWIQKALASTENTARKTFAAPNAEAGGEASVGAAVECHCVGNKQICCS